MFQRQRAVVETWLPVGPSLLARGVPAALLGSPISRQSWLERPNCALVLLGPHWVLPYAWRQLYWQQPSYSKLSLARWRAERLTQPLVRHRGVRDLLQPMRPPLRPMLSVWARSQLWRSLQLFAQRLTTPALLKPMPAPTRRTLLTGAMSRTLKWRRRP
jgi:hypothetical protein